MGLNNFQNIWIYLISVLFSIVDASLKVPPIVHFTWFYKNNQTKIPYEMKFYQMICMLAAFKKIKPYKILCEIFDTWSVRLITHFQRYVSVKQSVII